MTIRKTELRKESKEILANLDLKQISAQICEVLKNNIQIMTSQKVLLYWPLKDEIDIKPLIQNLIEQGKSCYLPKFCPEHFVSFSQYSSAQDLVKSDEFGCFESSQRPEFDFPQLDLVLVPGLAFDTKGFRLGRGKGFYDRLLSRCVSARKIGIIPESLVFEYLPIDAWDQCVNCLATEYRFRQVS